MGADKLNNFSQATDNSYNYQPQNEIVSGETAGSKCVWTCVCVSVLYHLLAEAGPLTSDPES